MLRLTIQQSPDSPTHVNGTVIAPHTFQPPRSAKFVYHVSELLTQRLSVHRVPLARTHIVSYTYSRMLNEPFTQRAHSTSRLHISQCSMMCDGHERMVSRLPCRVE
eukprot:6336575-Prymnesium_polylepis.2